jgi:hypothetical protein
MWLPTSAAVKRVLDKQAGRPVEPLTQAEVRREGTRVAVPGRWWPDRDMLPSSAGKHGLELYYDEFVAGRELAEPVIVARGFVASLGQPAPQRQRTLVHRLTRRRTVAHVGESVPCRTAYEHPDGPPSVSVVDVEVVLRRRAAGAELRVA